MILSIDPGIRGVGSAIWEQSSATSLWTLSAATRVESPVARGAGPRECAQAAEAVVQWFRTVGSYTTTHLRVLVVEWPTTYKGRTSRGDARDLFPLAGVDAALAAHLPLAEVVHYVPSQWKSGVPKPESVRDPYPVAARVAARLSDHEKTRIRWPVDKRQQFDVVDAIGVGLYYLGRYERKRVIARE